MKNKISKILIALSIAPLALPAHAAVVTKIDVSGNRRMDAESVRILSGVKVGDNLDNAKINDVAKKLQSSGLFTKSNITQSGGVVKISVTESPLVSRVTIEGNDAVSTDDLKKEIKMESGAPFDESLIGADVQRMLSVYQRQGYFGTKIEPQKITLDGGRVNVVYVVDEGHPTYIDNIEFSGNKHFSSRDLRGAILSTEHAWWKFMATFDTYDSDRIKYDEQMLRQFYMRNGYVDVSVVATDGKFTQNREYYSVKFDVKEGAQYDFGKLKIENPFPDIATDDLYDLLPMSDGDTYNVDSVDAAISAIRGFVGDSGYAFINVDLSPVKNDKTRKIDLTFKIQKTNRMYLNHINIIGNMRTFDSVIEHQMDIRDGDPFSLQTIDTAKQRMMQTQYYKNVDMVPTRVAGTNEMNLDVKVDEQPTGELSGGLGWSNINGFMVDAGITEKNFMGRGQTVQLQGQVAQYQKQAVLSFTEPYLFDRELSAGFDINYTAYNYSSLGSFGYDRNSFMIGGRLGWKLTEHWSQMLRLTASFDDNFDLHSMNGWERDDLYTLGTSFRYYNLDTDFAQQTSTGVVANVSAAYTGFGISTNEYMRYDASITGLVNFLSNRWQLKSSLEGGALETFGDGYIPRMYRYFLGADSLRGFDIAGTGSRNWAYDTYALGGMWKINGTTQLNFPIFIPDEYQVKGFIFADYGILGKPPAAEDYYTVMTTAGPITGKNFIDQSWRVSAGVGVYWNSPMGPINFSWGWPLVKKSYDQEQRFLLSFAAQF